MNKTILIIEDEIRIRFLLKDYLLSEGFSVIEACDGEEGLKVFKNNNVDLILLDIMMPKIDGLTVLENIRTVSDIPIILLTAKSQEEDKLYGYDIGADDYVIKPFRTMELISRIYNVLRRYNKDKNVIEIGQVRIDLEANRVYVDNKEVEFTALEYKILVLLYTNAGKTVTREKILDKIWDVAGNFVNDNTLTVYVKRIRDKLGKSDVIKTIKGIGYRVDK